MPSPTARTSRFVSGSGPAVAVGLDQAARHHRRDPGEPEEADEQDRDQDRRPVVLRSGPRGRVDRASSARVRADQQPRDGQGRREPQPERHEPDGPEAGDGGDGRQDRATRSGRPSAASAGGASSARTWSVPRARPEQEAPRPARRPAARAAATGRPRRRRRCARSRRASRIVHRARWYARRGQPAAGLPATQASRSARDRVLSDVGRLDPGAAGLADAPAHVVELVGVVGVRVDRQQATHRRPPAGPAPRRGRGGAASRSSRAPCRSGRPRRRPRPSRGRGRRGRRSCGRTDGR